MSAIPVAHIGTVPGRARGFLSGAHEIDDEGVRVEGDLPSWLRGTLLLNGPALWELPGGQLEHWFDGYGMWQAPRIDDARVRYRSRFCASESYRRSMAVGAPVYGEFGSRNPASLFTRIKAPRTTDNPAVVMSRHGERRLSVTETPKLTYFDPDSLETQERLDLGERAEPMHLMSAHARSHWHFASVRNPMPTTSAGSPTAAQPCMPWRSIPASFAAGARRR
jgi:beta,beta-carotene 9',10'-dioxygenase